MTVLDLLGIAIVLCFGSALAGGVTAIALVDAIRARRARRALRRQGRFAVIEGRAA